MRQAFLAMKKFYGKNCFILKLNDYNILKLLSHSKCWAHKILLTPYGERVNFPELGVISVIVISNKNGKLFLLKLSYSKEYLSQSKLKWLYYYLWLKPEAWNTESNIFFQTLKGEAINLMFFRRVDFRETILLASEIKFLSRLVCWCVYLKNNDLYQT